MVHYLKLYTLSHVVCKQQYAYTNDMYTHIIFHF